MSLYFAGIVTPSGGGLRAIWSRTTATRADVMKAMDGHIAGHASLVAPFNR